MEISTRSLMTIILMGLFISGPPFGSGLRAAPGVPSSAQGPAAVQEKITITGTVTAVDAPGGLPGVNITEKGTANGTITGPDGRYSIEVNRGATLVFSAIGYVREEFLIENQSVIDVSFTADITELNELVVIGYGTVKKKDVTGALSRVTGASLTSGNMTNVANGLQGKIPANIVQTSGAPGANARIEIRGISSLTGANDPLWVVDGVPMQSNNVFLNPNDIENIEILKDASATAIYGSRGSNGVVLVTTKKGKAGEKNTTISYDGWVGFDQVAKSSIPDLQNGEEYAQYRRTAFQNAGQPFDDDLIFDDVQLEMLQSGQYTDWFDLVWGGNAVSNNHNLGVVTSGENSVTTISLGLLNENSVISSADFSRYNLRFNNTLHLSKKFTLNTNILANHSIRNIFSPNAGHAVPLNPLGRPYDEDGNLQLYGNPAEALITNPLAEVQNNKNEVKNHGFLGSLSLQWEIVEGLEYKIFAGADYSSGRTGFYQGSETIARSGAPFAASYTNQTVMYTILDNILSYNRTFGVHRINAVAGYNMESNRSERIFLQGTNIDYEGLYYNLGAAATIMDKATGLEEWGISSFMGRVNYTYDDRYIATFTYRRDGSSRLAPEKRWAGFPSVAVAWNMKQENFLETVSFINDLRIRASWGTTGNTNVSPYATLGRLSQTFYTWDEEPALGYAPAQIPNPSLGWETTKERNLGVDFNLFKGILAGSVDLYRRNTTELMLPRLLPPSSGFDRVTQNIGEVKNEGIELTLSGRIIDKEKLKWNLGLVFAKNNNEIVSLATASNDIGNSWFIGEPIRVNYELDYLGVWQLGEEAEAAVYNAKPGFPKYADIANVDEANKRISLDQDRVIIPRDPVWVGGLNTDVSYKGVFLSVNLNIRSGVKDVSQMHSNRGERYNGLDIPYWTPENPTNTDPMPDAGGSRQLLSDSDFYIHDLSFVRLSNIQLGYDIPASMLQKAKIKTMRVYVNVRNPYIWTDYEGMDPEVATSHYHHPLLTSYQVGLNLNF